MFNSSGQSKAGLIPGPKLEPTNGEGMTSEEILAVMTLLHPPPWQLVGQIALEPT
jgi:hypothetical protein